MQTVFSVYIKAPAGQSGMSPGAVSYRFLERAENCHSGITSYCLDWKKKMHKE